MTSLLLNGDCLEELSKIDDNSVDLFFLDLPYGITNAHWDCPIDLTELWKHLLRIKKLNTPLFFTTTTKFGIDLIMSAPKKCPFKYDLVWEKSVPCGHLLAKTRPMRNFEMIYVFYEKPPFYDLSSHQRTVVKERDAGQKNGELYGGGKGKVTEGKYDPPLPLSILKIKSTRGKHSTEKPVALMSWILKYFSKEGDVVCDPTMGSGSTGVACNNMNRNFIGIEKDPEIYKVAVSRNS